MRQLDPHDHTISMSELTHEDNLKVNFIIDRILMTRQLIRRPFIPHETSTRNRTSTEVNLTF